MRLFRRRLPKLKDRRRPENAALRAQLEEAHRRQVTAKVNAIEQTTQQNSKAVAEVEARVRLLRIQSGL